jgi:hypothetical protein
VTTKKRARAARAEPLPIPNGRALKRLDALYQLAKAQEHAKAVGVMGTRAQRKKSLQAPSREEVIAKWNARVSFLIELEVRWRMRQLGIPYTDEMAKRFPPFDMRSKHRMDIEAEHTREHVKRMKAQWQQEREAKSSFSPAEARKEKQCLPRRREDKDETSLSPTGGEGSRDRGR